MVISSSMVGRAYGNPHEVYLVSGERIFYAHHTPELDPEVDTGGEDDVE